MSNLSSLIKSSAETEIEEELTNKDHQHQLNRSFIIGKVCQYIRSLAITLNYKKKLSTLLTRIQKMRSIIRPDRRFKRIS